MISLNPNPDVPKRWHWFILDNNGGIAREGFTATRGEARRAVYELWKQQHPVRQ